ncbi:MAG: sodium:solute symporter [Candidatus Cyclobacteriaceae bacterium M2_1C_046]
MELNFYEKLHGIDITIVVLYLLFVVLLGLYFGSKHEDAEDYFLAGRNLTWPLIGFSLFASNMSSNSLVGLTGSGYVSGFSVFSYEWMAIFVLIIFAVFFLPFYLKNRIYTVPEYLERRFDYKTRAYASAIAIVLNVLVDISATLYAGGILIQLIFPQFELWVIIAILSVIAGLYTISGGLSAVVYTDAIQAVILIFGSILITWFAWEASGGFAEVAKITDPSHFSIIQPTDDPDLPWPGLFTGVFLLGFYFWGTNQYITQRALASKTTLEGQWGSMFAGLLKLSILFIMIFPGAFARVLYPDVEKVDTLYSIMLFDLLPTGILGLVLAGFIAALMSSIDSGLNSVSTLVTMDFINKFSPGRSQKNLMKMGRIVTFIVMIIATAWAPQIIHFEKLWDYLQQALSWFCPPIIALFIMGLFWKRANTRGAYWTVIIGSIITVLSIVFTNAEWKPHFLYVTGIHFAASCIAMIIGSYLAPPPSEEVLQKTVWRVEAYRAETKELQKMAWYKNYRYHAAALVFIVLIILIVY